MKDFKSKLLILIIIAILIIYIIYNIYLNRTKKVDNIENDTFNEKIIDNNLRIGIINFDTINPILSNNTEIEKVSKLIYEPLINLTHDYKLEPCLAVEWAKLDRYNYLIKLRENVKWHDGSEFNADDVIFTYNTIYVNSEESIYYNNIKYIDKIKKIDNHTIKITTNKEIPYFEYNLTFPIISNKNLIGTGMYYISNFQDENIILKKNNNWWDKKERKIETIRLNFYKNLKSAISNFENSNIDMFITSESIIDEHIQMLQTNKIKVINKNYDYISINNNHDILKYKEVRQAISYAIDKEKIIEQIYKKQYEISNFPLDFGCYLYSNNSEKIEYNVEKSKKILEDAGWKYNSNNWGKEIDNIYKRIDIEILVNKENENKVKVAEVIKEQLNMIGINLEIIKKSENEYQKSIKESKYDLAIVSSEYMYSPSLEQYFEEENISNYKNNQIIMKMKQIQQESNENNKRKTLNEIISKYNEDVPYISLYYDTYTIVYSNNLVGAIEPNAYNMFYNIENWYREYDKP